MRLTSNTDRLYPGLVAVFGLLTLGLIVRQINLFINNPLAGDFRWLITNDYLTWLLIAFGLLTLIWRVSFALLYRPCGAVSHTNLPSLSVIIPAFNEGEQVLATVRSILASNYPLTDLEVICVDDGSKDDTWHWMQKAEQEFPNNVTALRQAKNAGKRKALMAGFNRCSGEVIVTIDSDSEVLTNTLERIVSPFVFDQRIGSVAGNVRVLNIDSGPIAKMMEVSFTSAFDFIRAGQSVFGGVFCTPGALSAYRASVLRPLLAEWEQQTFLGQPANIGEDRALTNLVLASGKRVTYARDAVVMTKVPEHFTQLRKMLLRWARSNVRENLVMMSYIFKPFRQQDSGAPWVRLFAATQLLRMTLIEGLKIVLLLQLFLNPGRTLVAIVIGGLFAAIIPGIVHRIRYGGWFGFKWALPFSYFWLICLSWISIWGLLTAFQSAWLTRGKEETPPLPAGNVLAHDDGLNPLAS
ncbi:chitooligosaccharide synthase NodC [Aurantivibrio infirmus]